MALEIKGLKGKAVKAGSMFDRLGTAHAADVESLPAQFDALQDDITFAVQTLGNSVNGSGATDKPKEEPGEKQVITADDVGKIDQGSPAVGETSTFRAAE